jgi:hypothetical protein
MSLPLPASVVKDLLKKKIVGQVFKLPVVAVRQVHQERLAVMVPLEVTAEAEEVQATQQQQALAVTVQFLAVVAVEVALA